MDGGREGGRGWREGEMGPNPPDFTSRHSSYAMEYSNSVNGHSAFHIIHEMIHMLAGSHAPYIALR